MQFTFQVLILMGLVSMGVYGIVPFGCPPCRMVRCNTLNCPGGTHSDRCGCCNVCAKLLGQRCGRGPFGSPSMCDAGLRCDRPQGSFESGRCVTA